MNFTTLVYTPARKARCDHPPDIYGIEITAMKTRTAILISLIMLCMCVVTSQRGSLYQHRLNLIPAWTSNFEMYAI